MKHKFSIIIAVYNTPMDVFMNCINSVLNNTVFDKNHVEFVIVDDGSTKVSYDNYMFELQKSGVDINYIKLPENGGQFNARLIGMEKSKYPWILGLDSDDMYTSDALECIDSWITGGVDLIYWLTNDDYNNYINESEKYTFAPNEGIYDKDSAWKLITSIHRYIRGYLVTKCVKRDLMLRVVKKLRELDLGRITLFDDQVITYEIFNQLTGKLKVELKGLYEYQSHGTDTRFTDPTESEVIEEMDKKSVLRSQLDKYMNSISDRVMLTSKYPKYVLNRDQVLVTICKVHAKDLTEVMWNKLRTIFEYDILKDFSNYNYGVFERFLD